MEWSDPPSGTRSYVLVVDDPDAPAGTWGHWLLWDIPAAVQSLEEAFRPGQIGRSGTNDFDELGYGGPCPPRGHGPHRYYFRLYALDTSRLGEKEGAKHRAVDKALAGHILGEACVMGRYERQ
jgi:Raf kinase inhibitor-like YbhB/YbcL family protein